MRALPRLLLLLALCVVFFPKAAASMAAGNWSASALLAPGSHYLTATATHLSGWVAPPANSFFQVQPRAETVTDGFDGMGNVSSRVWSGGKNQTLTWDGNGRLIKVVQTGVTPFTWTAIYDGLNRRVKTAYTPSGGATVTTNSVFDPQVEFLELGLAINGSWNWKVYGPDLSGSYGGLQGLGGLEAVVGNDGVTRGIVNDWFGNAAGYVAVAGGAMTWSSAQFLAWGPAPGWGTAPLDGTKPLYQLLGYRGLTLDPPGYLHMGLRDYAPEAGRWLSPDSMGHGASMSLYDYCGNDPLNVFDMDGRFGKATGGLSGGAYNAGAGAVYQQFLGGVSSGTPDQIRGLVRETFTAAASQVYDYNDRQGSASKYDTASQYLYDNYVMPRIQAGRAADAAAMDTYNAAYSQYYTTGNVIAMAHAQLGGAVVNGFANMVGLDLQVGPRYDASAGRMSLGASVDLASPGQVATAWAFAAAPPLLGRGLGLFAEGGGSKLMYHYTTSEESSFAKGLLRDSSVTDKLYTDPFLASQELGIPIPNKVIPIKDVGQFIPNKPSVVRQSNRFWGGGNDFINPQPVPPSQFLPARPLRR